MNGTVAIIDPDPHWSEDLVRELRGLGLGVADPRSASIVIRFVPVGDDPTPALQSGTPTILTTNHDDTEHRLLALSRGASDYAVGRGVLGNFM